MGEASCPPPGSQEAEGAGEIALEGLLRGGATFLTVRWAHPRARCMSLLSLLFHMSLVPETFSQTRTQKDALLIPNESDNHINHYIHVRFFCVVQISYSELIYNQKEKI